MVIRYQNRQSWSWCLASLLLVSTRASGVHCWLGPLRAIAHIEVNGPSFRERSNVLASTEYTDAFTVREKTEPG